MKNFRSLSVILLASMLVACGPSKKADQGKNGDGLGKTGQGQGDGSGGGGGGNNPTPAPQTFEQYCNSLHGTTNINTCKYVWKKASVSLPANPPDIYRVNVATIHEGMSVQAYGDPNNSGILYVQKDDKLTPLFTVNEKTNRARLVGIGNGGIVFISTAPFTVPAQITIYECRSPEKTLINCLD